MANENKTQYLQAKPKLLKDKSICEENRKWYKQCLEYQETKGKRKNGLPALDESCYKTLLTYIVKFKNLNKWYNNNPWVDIREKEFKKIYEDLEEGRICKSDGSIYEDRTAYYSKIFKAKPFEIIGKKEMAEKIIEYNVKKDKEVRFIPDYKTNLKKIVSCAIQPSHKVLIQVLGDWAENIFSILQLEKKDFERVIEEDTKEPEYLLNLYKEILKRARTPRREPSLFAETTEMLDDYLENLKPKDKLFEIGLRQAEMVFKRAVLKSGVKLQNGLVPTLKDLRSSLACYLLGEGWTTDEIKGRLGHKPSSRVLDVYVSYLALNKKKSKKKLQQGDIKKLQDDLDKYKDKSKRDSQKIQELNDKIDAIYNKLAGLGTSITGDNVRAIR